MKTERRHELQTNTLADALGRGLQKVKPYQQLILGCILAAVMVFAVVRYMSVQSSSNRAESWNDYLSATSTDDMDALSAVVENHPGTPAAFWANIYLGDHYLAQGSQQLFVNKNDAKAELQKAETAYLAVSEKAQDPMLLQRATLGLARTYESLIELDKARQYYEQLIEKWPDSVYTASARQRLADLNEQSTRQFYDWFAEFEPQSPLIEGPGTPGIHPPFNLDDMSDNPLQGLNAPSNAPETPAAPPETPSDSPDAATETVTPPSSTPAQDSETEPPAMP